ARAAAQDAADDPSHVGEAVEAVAEGDRVLTHLFECTSPAYRGWRWAVTVARASRAKLVTVDEVVLLPGPDALLPPEWLPWSDRLRPGDLGVGDLLPTPADDPRLVQGFEAVVGGELASADDEDAAAVWELGLGRARVLSRIGRDDASDRWYSGDRGPGAPIALAAPAQCSTCGFYLPLSGTLRLTFGVCANEYAPDDARVVSADHGCGAHSEAAVVPSAPAVPPPVLDNLGYDVVSVRPQPREGSVDEATPGEDLGHS
ncbi:MAG: DUF3027 domain-containing protein, partial [Actinomycetota bacterium]|nr:DUF3027 domain-containing protein [Actinomycetota bacterium]